MDESFDDIVLDVFGLTLDAADEVRNGFGGAEVPEHRDQIFLEVDLIAGPVLQAESQEVGNGLPATVDDRFCPPLVYAHVGFGGGFEEFVDWDFLQLRRVRKA